MAKQYVQHISGQGAKWEVAEVERAIWMALDATPNENEWLVCDARHHVPAHLLPKSEYRLCEPPPPVVQWKDVTAECEVTERGWIVHKDRCTTEDNGYRRRKIRVVDWDKKNNEAWAIIIEQKVTE